MANVISDSAVKSALRPWLGSMLVDGSDIAPSTAQVLRSYAPYKEELDGLCKRVESFLFNNLNRMLGNTMMVELDDGSRARIFVSELSQIADDVMGVLFDSFSPYSVNFERLKDYSMHYASLAAMRVLYLKYDEFQTPEEKRLMARIIREGYPPFRYEKWLKDA